MLVEGDAQKPQVMCETLELLSTFYETARAKKSDGLIHGPDPHFGEHFIVVILQKNPILLLQTSGEFIFHVP